MSLPAATYSRERVLTGEELAAVYTAARDYPYPFGPIVALLVLTGQRRGEVAALRWEWIDTDQRMITVPSSITKNKRAHRFPYGDSVAAVLANLPELNEYVFPSSRGHVRHQPTTVFNGWSNAKVAFDQRLEHVAPYTLPDLRRTFSSNLAALGTPIHVTEKLLNHVSGTLGGVAAIYNRHTYIDEMREAINAYEKHLNSLCS
jgi:integrase